MVFFVYVIFSDRSPILTVTKYRLLNMEQLSIEELGRRAGKARREGRLAEALADAEAVVALCRSKGASVLLVRALMFQGQIERDSKQNDRALRSYEEAVSLSREVDVPLRLGHTIRHLADLQCDVGHLEAADSLYRESLAIYRTQPKASPGDLANAVRAHAVLKDAMKMSCEARILWEEALALYDSIGLDEGVEECRSHLDES